MKEIIDVEYHLGEQPVGSGIEWGVDEVAADVGLDRQWQEVSRLWMDVEVGRASCTVSLWCYGGFFITGLIAVLVSSVRLLDV